MSYWPTSALSPTFQLVNADRANSAGVLQHSGGMEGGRVQWVSPARRIHEAPLTRAPERRSSSFVTYRLATSQPRSNRRLRSHHSRLGVQSHACLEVELALEVSVVGMPERDRPLLEKRDERLHHLTVKLGTGDSPELFDRLP